MRHPALAIDPAGDALLAYNSATNEAHLNMRGAIAITYRKSGGSFAPPTIVDSTPSSAPAVAIGRDGTGVVAWTHDRRLYVVSVSADGQIGKVKRIASPDGVVGLVAAAGEGGAATRGVGQPSRRPARPAVPAATYFVRALGRTAGHAFAAVDTVASSSDYVRGVSAGTDEDGRVTLAWAREHFGDDRSVGNGGVTSAVLATTARAGKPFPAPLVVAKRGTRYLTPPDVVAANGRVALTWGSTASRRDLGVQAAVGPAGAIGPPQTVVAKTLKQSSFGPQPLIQATLAPDGTADGVLRRADRDAAAGARVRAEGRRRPLISAPRGTAAREGPGGMGAEGAHARRPCRAAARRAGAAGRRTRAGRARARPGRRRRGRRR